MIDRGLSVPESLFGLSVVLSRQGSHELVLVARHALELSNSGKSSLLECEKSDELSSHSGDEGVVQSFCGCSQSCHFGKDIRVIALMTC